MIDIIDDNNIIIYDMFMADGYILCANGGD